MSVKDTTPVRRPDRPAPGNAAAGTEVKVWLGSGDAGVVVLAGGTITVGPGEGLFLPPRLPELPDNTGGTDVGVATGWLG